MVRRRYGWDFTGVFRWPGRTGRGAKPKISVAEARERSLNIISDSGLPAPLVISCIDKETQPTNIQSHLCTALVQRPLDPLFK